MNELCKEEYETLRKEVEAAMAELKELESRALLAVAAIFTWLVTQRSEGLIRLGWLVPAALVLFFILRAIAINKHLGWLGEYLKQHEEKYMQPDMLGWEHFLSEPCSGSRAPRRSFRGKTTMWFWAILFVTTFLGGCFGFKAQSTGPKGTGCTWPGLYLTPANATKVGSGLPG